MNEFKFRHELKFVCTEYELNLIEQRIKNVCSKDLHAGIDGKYSIRSLYFDTYNDEYYLENKMGIDCRKKYRIRIYNGSTEAIKLECKYAYRGMKAKEVCNISIAQYYDILDNNPTVIQNDEQKLLETFVIEKNMKLLKPKIIVEYERTPYIYRAGNVRVTFDRNIMSSTDIEHFTNGDLSRRNIMPEGVHLLEVKYDDFLPSTILKLITAEQMLRKTSFSKYMLCRDYNNR